MLVIPNGSMEEIKKVLAIDPGNRNSGWVVMSGREFIAGNASEANEDMFDVIKSHGVGDGCCVVCEWIQSYGMPVGKEVFETCWWVGRFAQYAHMHATPFTRVFRKDVKMHLCGQAKAKDANVRMAILDLYPASGGGKTPQIGTKSQPGPLRGVTSHMWPAVGLALTFQESVVTEVL